MKFGHEATNAPAVRGIPKSPKDTAPGICRLIFACRSSPNGLDDAERVSGRVRSRADISAKDRIGQAL